MKVDRRISEWTLLTFPFVGLMFAFFHVFQLDYVVREELRKYWGGNPMEVNSHLIDLVLMSGNVAALAWFVIVEAWFRPAAGAAKYWKRPVFGCAVAFLVISGAVGIAFDSEHGEGTVFLVYGMFFLPLLAMTWFLLRDFAKRLKWNPLAVTIVALVTALIHYRAQLIYEPSETGAPNGLIFLFGLGQVALVVIQLARRPALDKQRLAGVDADGI